MTDSNRRPFRHVLCVAAALLLGVGAVAAIEPHCGVGWAAAAVRAVRAIASVLVVFFVPGVFLVPWICRRRTPTLSAALGWAFACNVVLLVGITSGVKDAVGPLSFLNLFAPIAVLSLIGGVCFYWRFWDWEVVQDFTGLGRWVAGGAVALLAFAWFTIHPFLPSEHDYFSDANGWQQLAACIAPPVDLAQRGAGYEVVEGEATRDPHVYRFVQNRLVIRFRNAGPRLPLRITAVVQNYDEQDVAVECTFSGEAVWSGIAPGRFIRGKYWDNRQSNNVLLCERINVPTGESDLVVTLKSPDGGAPPAGGRVLWHDLTNLDRAGLLRRFSKRFIIANTDDVRQHLSLARSLIESLIPIDNTRHYYITDWPLHYYQNAFALVLGGNRLETFWWAHCVKLLLVLAMVVRIGCTSADGSRAAARTTKLLVTSLAALALMNTTKALPIGDSAAYHDNTEMLLVAAMAIFMLQRRWGLFFVSGCLVSLTQHPTILLVGLLMATGLLWREERPVMIRCLLGYAGFLMVCGLVLFAVGHLVGDWPQWAFRLTHDDSRRFDLLREAQAIPSVTVPYILERSWAFCLLQLTMVGFLPLVLLAGCRRFSLWLVIATALYLLPVCASTIHRIHYVSLPIVTLMAASLPVFGSWRKKRRVFVGAMALVAGLGCTVYLSTASRDTSFRFSQQVLYASAPHPTLAAGLMDSAKRLQRLGKLRQAIGALKRAALESYTHRAPAYTWIAALYDELGEPAAASRWRARADALGGP